MTRKLEAGKVCREIGKLEDGSPDPCYDCPLSDTDTCQVCDDYGQYQKPITPIK